MLGMVADRDTGYKVVVSGLASEIPQPTFTFDLERGAGRLRARTWARRSSSWITAWCLCTTMPSPRSSGGNSCPSSAWPWPWPKVGPSTSSTCIIWTATSPRAGLQTVRAPRQKNSPAYQLGRISDTTISDTICCGPSPQP
ncbi:hypothetical protein MPTK1_6g09150 [Marchantia polymorpha subsp. ruderalis]|uniref:Uncharacterized protein n=2 Tax=Marchantia polymorpha TaxID=3197 RepID=A0AAF6BQ52_MARPO|nr:hypothetical protein MARPO_0060s0004 [Marchantia polymorpha]BBN14136.1 hypothetical protein Mp_6g09150 [Marchantia polymorpha subsp. ruderalis]|eukprot:PTQ36907.1 hypothetical protein MARPO_0060s0004 [Marchantia polymorpha]